MITADQLVAHLIGDYLLQSDWMANKKRTSSVAALVHALVYTLPFVVLRAYQPNPFLISHGGHALDGSPEPWWCYDGTQWGACGAAFSSVLLALAVIAGTHFLIDRFGLARYVVWAKNFLAPRWLTRTSGQIVKSCECHPVCANKAHGLGTSTLTIRFVRNLPWDECRATGYPPDRPPFLAVWLLIIADNVLHILINGAALRWL